MVENKSPDRDFDFDRAIAAIRRAAAELAKPEVQAALTVVGEGARAMSSIQDAVKAVAVNDPVKAVAIQDAVKSVAIQDAVKAVSIQDAVKAVAIQDAVKAVVGGMSDPDWSTPDATERLTKILSAIHSAAEAARKKEK